MAEAGGAGGRPPDDAPDEEPGAPAGDVPNGVPAEGMFAGAAGQAQYAAAEQDAIRAECARGESPRCPRDGARMTHRAVGGGSFGLGYARRREWVMCPTCRRSVLFDVKRGTRN